MARKKKEEPAHRGAPGWMVTYGDMMSLLLVFFVMIVAFSSIEVDKFRAAMGSFRGALMPWSPAPAGMSLIEQPVIGVSEDVFEEAAAELQAAVQQAELGEFIEVHQVSGGVKLVFSEPFLFDVGKDELKPQALPVLRKVTEIALNFGAGEVVIEGHTDDTPISTERFPSNWELSAARALRVLKVFQGGGYHADRLAATGYGEYRPRVKIPSNATHEEKAPNRRVEILLDLTRKGLEAIRRPNQGQPDIWAE